MCVCVCVELLLLLLLLFRLMLMIWFAQLMHEPFASDTEENSTTDDDSFNPSKVSGLDKNGEDEEGNDHFEEWNEENDPEV